MQYLFRFLSPLMDLTPPSSYICPVAPASPNSTSQLLQVSTVTLLTVIDPSSGRGAATPWEKYVSALGQSPGGFALMKSSPLRFWL